MVLLKFNPNKRIDMILLRALKAYAFSLRLSETLVNETRRYIPR